MKRIKIFKKDVISEMFRFADRVQLDLLNRSLMMLEKEHVSLTSNEYYELRCLRDSLKHVIEGR